MRALLASSGAHRCPEAPERRGSPQPLALPDLSGGFPGAGFVRSSLVSAPVGGRTAGRPGPPIGRRASEVGSEGTRDLMPAARLMAGTGTPSRCIRRACAYSVAPLVAYWSSQPRPRPMARGRPTSSRSAPVWPELQPCTSPLSWLGGELRPPPRTYAPGVVLYECVAERRPFDGESPVEVALAHLYEQPPPLPRQWRQRFVRC